MNPRRADALVIGAGAAGMMGALAAASAGARVLLLEKSLGGPSNLLVSGGLFPGAGTRWQREAGVQDSPEAFAADIRVKGGDSVNESIVDAVARASAEAIHFLADAAGIPVHLMDIDAPSHGVRRLHATPAQSGRELHALMRAALARFPAIETVDGVEVDSIAYDGGYRVGAGNASFEAPSLLLVPGGFASNRDLLLEFAPEIAGALHIGAGPNDGFAVHWGRRLGATVAQMAGYQGQGHVNPSSLTRLGMSLPRLGAFMVNRDGHWFVEPEVGPSELAARVLAQPGGVALEVYDRRIHDTAMKQGPYAEAVRAGKVMSTPDAEALAREAGLPATFLETFAARGGHLAAPLYASWVTGALAHTQGGLAVDGRGRVLRAGGEPVEGLYAAGGAAAGLAGVGGEGYLPGNGLAQSFALGLAAGREMAARAAVIPPSRLKSRPRA